jgi:hypothetical protein
MTADVLHLISATVLTVPWLPALYFVSRTVERAVLAVTYAAATVVALLSRSSTRRRCARQVLERHPFTRRK